MLGSLSMQDLLVEQLPCFVCDLSGSPLPGCPKVYMRNRFTRIGRSTLPSPKRHVKIVADN